MNANNTSLSNVSGASSLDELLTDTGVLASNLVDEVEYNDKIKYRGFVDKAAGGYEYQDLDGTDGGSTADYMREHTNFDELLSGLSSGERDAFLSWTAGHFMGGQQYGGFSNMDSRDQRYTRAYDKVLDKATLDEGITVTRQSTAQLLGLGLKLPTQAELKRMRGKVILSKGNMSTGVADDGLLIGSTDSSKPVEYKLHIAGGTTGAGMWVGDKRVNGWQAEQREFMTNRDTLWVVGKSTTKTKTRKLWGGDIQKTEIAVVHLYYLGRLPHDYK